MHLTKLHWTTQPARLIEAYVESSLFPPSEVDLKGLGKAERQLLLEDLQQLSTLWGYDSASTQTFQLQQLSPSAPLILKANHDSEISLIELPTQTQCQIQAIVTDILETFHPLLIL